MFKIAVNKSRRGTLHNRSKNKVNIDSQFTPIYYLYTYKHSKGKNVCSFALDVQWLSISNVFLQSNQS